MNTYHVKCLQGRFVHTPNSNHVVECNTLFINEVTGRILAAITTGDSAMTTLEAQRQLEEFLGGTEQQQIASSTFLVTSVVQLPQNSIVLPGFYDAHIHAIGAGIRTLFGFNFSPAQDWESGKQALRNLLGSECAYTRPWLVGAGWHRNWFDGEFPSSASLDEALADATKTSSSKEAEGESSEDVPPSSSITTMPQFVYLRDKSGHTVWFNSAAMRLFEDTFSKGSTEAEAEWANWKRLGYIQNGCVTEAAGDAAVKLLPPLTTEERGKAILNIQKRLLRSGIVGYQEAGLFSADLKGYAESYQKWCQGRSLGGDPYYKDLMRVRLLARLCPEDDPVKGPGDDYRCARDVISSIATAAESNHHQQQQYEDIQVGGVVVPIKCDGLKIFLDGSSSNGTAATLWDHQGGGASSGQGGGLEQESPNRRGKLLWDDASLVTKCGLFLEHVNSTTTTTAAAAAAHPEEEEAGLPTIHVHTIGDGAVAQGLRCLKQCTRDLQLAHVFWAPEEKDYSSCIPPQTKTGLPAVASTTNEHPVRQLLADCRAVMTPLWFKPSKTDPRYISHYGEASLKKLFPWQRFPRDQLAFGSDFEVTPFDPVQGLLAARASSLATGFPDGGSFSVGCKADFVVFQGGPEQATLQSWVDALRSSPVPSRVFLGGSEVSL